MKFLACVCFVAMIVCSTFLGGCDKQEKPSAAVLEGGQAIAQVVAYENITLNCGCTLRVRSALGCTEANFPELCVALRTVYDEAKKHADSMVAINDWEPSGDYEMVQLTCESCTCMLVVYVPDSCPCFEAKYYPELAAALNEVYRLTH